MHAYLFLIIQFFMHARSRKPYVYFRSIFVARAWFGIPPVLFLKNRQTGSYCEFAFKLRVDFGGINFDLFLQASDRRTYFKDFS